jgi:hypothetical protein
MLIASMQQWHDVTRASCYDGKLMCQPHLFGVGLLPEHFRAHVLMYRLPAAAAADDCIVYGTTHPATQRTLWQLQGTSSTQHSARGISYL